MKIVISHKNKWRIDVFDEDGKLLNMIAIPPKDSGERIDYIHRNWKYSYNYKGAVSHGILIIIKDGKAELKEVPYFSLTRLRRLL